MKAYFINSKHEYIIEVNVKDWKQKQKLIETNIIQIYPYEINGNDILTDENALMKDYSYNFVIDELYVVHGNALVIFHEYAKDKYKSVKNLTIKDLISRVRFLGKQYVDHSKLQFKVMEWN